MQDFIPSAELAKEVGCSASYIRKEVDRGKLTGERIGKRLLVVLRDEKLKTWLANPRRNSLTNSRSKKGE